MNCSGTSSPIALADTKEKNILAVGGVGAVCDSANVLSRVLGVAGVLSNQNDTAVLRSLETEGLIPIMSIPIRPSFSHSILIFSPAYLVVGVSSVLANDVSLSHPPIVEFSSV